MLRVRVDINGYSISEVRAVRVEGTADHDSVGTYEVSFAVGDEAVGIGKVRHRYGDGGLKLGEEILRLAHSALNFEEEY